MIRHSDSNSNDENGTDNPHEGPFQSRAVRVAIVNLTTMDIPGTPTVETARIVRSSQELPLDLDDRRITALRIKEGRPDHGEMRSDAHISRFDVELPIRQWNLDSANECHSCRHDRGRYSYNAYHHIAGSELFQCLHCGEYLFEKRWG